MSLTSGFFDAMEQGEGNYDRVYTAAEFAHYFSLLVGNGVFPSPDTGLNVLSSDPASMTVKIGDGSGWINGYFVTVAGGHSVTLEAASGAGTRIDSIIMQWNSNDRKINIIAKSGTASGDPKPVTLQRDAELWELELAQITVGAGVSSVDQTKIKDMRADSDRCGLVTALLKGIDPSTFLKQSEAEFNQWFSTIMNKISSEDVAGSLLKMITEVDNRSKETESLVKNISVVDISKIGDMFLSGRSLTDSRVLLCDGSVISKDEYPELFNAIRYSFGGASKSQQISVSEKNRTLNDSAGGYSAIKLSATKYLVYAAYNNTIFSAVLDVVKKTLSNAMTVSGTSYLNVYKGMYRASQGSTTTTSTIDENGLHSGSSSYTPGTMFDEVTTPYGILSVEYNTSNVITSIKIYRSATDVTVLAVSGTIKHSFDLSNYKCKSILIFNGIQYINAGGTLCKVDGLLVSEVTLPSVEGVTKLTVKDIVKIGNKFILSASVTLSSITAERVYEYKPDKNSLVEITNISGDLYTLDENTLLFNKASYASGYSFYTESIISVVNDNIVVTNVLQNNIVPFPINNSPYIQVFDMDGNLIPEYSYITYTYSSRPSTYNLEFSLNTAVKNMFALPKELQQQYSTGYGSSIIRSDIYTPIVYIKAKENKE